MHYLLEKGSTPTSKSLLFSIQASCSPCKCFYLRFWSNFVFFFLTGAELLIRKGVDVNISDESELTPLHHAAILGSESLVKSLLQSKVPIKTSNNS